MLGHTLGAAGAIEAIVSILTIRDGCVPPTINLADPDPEAAGLDLTPNVAATHDDPGGAQQLVRVRRPEHGADLHGSAGDDRRRRHRPRRPSRAMAATSSCSR